jgi:hypothetical protein
MYKAEISAASHESGTARPAHALVRRFRAGVIAFFGAVTVAGCIIPFDTGSNAAAIALEQMDQAMYSMRDETALLQAQIDSLSGALRKTDSILRWLANLTGNPVVEQVPLWPLPTPRTDTSPTPR